MATSLRAGMLQGDDVLQTYELNRALRRGEKSSAREDFAKALLKQGTDTSPVPSHLTGLARALTAGLGGYQLGQAERESRDEERMMLADMLGKRSQQQAEEQRQLASAGVPGFSMPMPQIAPGVARPQPTAAPDGAVVEPAGMIAPPPTPAPAPVDANLIQALSAMAASGNRTAAGAMPGVQFQYADAEAKRREQRAEELALAREARADARANRETFGAPVELQGANGPVLAQIGNRGTVRPLAGYQAGPSADANKTGLVPVMGYDASGKQVAMFPDGRGGFKVANTGDISLMPRSRDINLGTEIVTINQNGEMIARRPIDIAGREAQEKVGAAQGVERAGAANAMRAAEEGGALIDSLLAHPALKLGTGMTGQLLNRIPGTPTFDFSQRVAQIQGRAFLQAFESLKGGGAITEVEGKKATDAIARLSTAQSEPAFREALTELRDVMGAARGRAAALSRGGAPLPGGALVAEPPATPAARAPQAGAVENGYRFRGGDPANPTSWERVQ